MFVLMDSSSQINNANNVRKIVRLVLNLLMPVQAVRLAPSVIKEIAFHNVQPERFPGAVLAFHVINPAMDVLVHSSTA